MSNTIQIGPSVEAIKEARASIIEILKCTSADQYTKVAALEAFSEITSIKNTTITNCTFYDGFCSSKNDKKLK